MLTRIDLGSFILIKRAHLEIKSNFAAITGESGSGKSMILDAIRFCLGLAKNKENSSASGQELSVSLEFDVGRLQDAKDLLEEAGIGCEEESIILRRNLNAEQKSKCFVNDTLVNIGFIKKLSGCLLEIHSQDDRSFDDTAKLALNIIDQFAKIFGLKNLGDLFREYSQLGMQIFHLQQESEKTAMERGFYEFAIKEIAELNLKLGEEEELEILKNTASNFAQIHEHSSSVLGLLRDQENIIGYSWSAQVKCLKLHEISANQKFAQFAVTLEKIAIELEECASLLEKEMPNENQELNVDQINDRLYLIKNVSRKYGVATNQLNELAEDYQERLNQLDNFAERISTLEAQKNDIWLQYLAVASEISIARKKAALEISKLINEQLKELKMEGALIEFQFETLSEAKATAKGIDLIEIMAKTNQTQPMLNLKDIASGGEKSRIMLIIKSISNAESDKTLIFDEIDSGIGGSTASAVGRKIKALSKTQQVILITHNAQVAAMSDQLFRVAKTNHPSGTAVTIQEMLPEEKKEEIARMISGDFITDEALAQAENLIYTS